LFIEHPPENSMASFSFTSTVLDEDTTFFFPSWICVANGSGGFNGHLADSRKPEAFATSRCSDLDEFVDNLDELLLPGLTGEIKRMSVFVATSTHAAPGLLGSGLKIHHVICDNNVGADLLSKLVSDRANVPPGIFVHELHHPSIKIPDQSTIAQGPIEPDREVLMMRSTGG
jgi:hypothetical protein